MTFKNKVTFKYLVSITMIATILTGTYWLKTQTEAQSEKHARIVKVSEMQVTLASQIALFAYEVFNEKSQEKRDGFHKKMRAALSAMVSNNRTLLVSDMNEDLKYIYYGKLGLADSIQDYTGKADSFLSVYEQKGISVLRTKKEMLDDITTVARSGFINDLETAASEYQKDKKFQKALSKGVGLMLLGFCLLTLLFELLFVFRPFLNELLESREKLKQAHDKLLSFSSQVPAEAAPPGLPLKGLGGIIENVNFIGERDEPAEMIRTSMSQIELLISDIVYLAKEKRGVIDPKLGELKEKLGSIQMQFDDFEDLL